MKRIVVVPIIILLVFTSSCSINGGGEHIAETKGIRVYNTNYIEEYGETLDVMFDFNWDVIGP